MSKINDGGPAFQTFRQHALGAVLETSAGMSLRDYFAAHVASGLIAKGYDMGEVTHLSYATADALISEREKQS